MEENLHQLIRWIPIFTGFCKSQVVQDFWTINSMGRQSDKYDLKKVGIVPFWEDYLCFSTITIPRSLINTPPLKLTARTRKWMVGRRSFPFGARPIFRCEPLVSGSVYHQISSTSGHGQLCQGQPLGSWVPDGTRVTSLPSEQWKKGSWLFRV